MKRKAERQRRGTQQQARTEPGQRVASAERHRQPKASCRPETESQRQLTRRGKASGQTASDDSQDGSDDDDQLFKTHR
jgi:hypothetical protein